MNRHGRLIIGEPGQGMWAVRARTVMTMTPDRPPLDNGVVLCRHDRIVTVDTHQALASEISCPVLDVGDATLAPGLLNSHVHLEVSHLRGRTAQGKGFPAWIRSMLAQGMDQPHAEAMDAAARKMRNLGVIHAGDVSTRFPDLAGAALARYLPLFHILAEFIGYPRGPKPTSPAGLVWTAAAQRALDQYPDAVAAAGHALYSTSPQVLRAAKKWCVDHDRVYSLHLAEHTDETDVLVDGSGEFCAMLTHAILPRDYSPPGMRAVALADSLGLLDQNTLAVHCVQVDDADMDVLARRGTSVCLCPRSNHYIGVGRAPWEAMRAKGLRLCLGTDSLASNHDLDPWNEVRFLLENSSSHITLHEALVWMTLNPARVFGLEDRAGTLAPGLLAAMSLVPEDLSLA